MIDSWLCRGFLCTTPFDEEYSAREIQASARRDQDFDSVLVGGKVLRDQEAEFVRFVARRNLSLAMGAQADPHCAGFLVP